MNIVALDLSLTATGWARGLGEDDYGVLRTGLRGMARLAWLRDQIGDLADGAALVVIEGYAYGTARGASQAHSLGELGGVVRLLLHDGGVPSVDVPPAVLKKYATGKGNARKEEVLVAAVKRLGYLGADNNEADAAFLWAMARDVYSGARMAGYQIEAASKIAWPDAEHLAWEVPVG